MFLQHQLTEMDLYSLRRFNPDVPIAISVRWIPSRGAWRADSTVILREYTTANGLYAVPMQRESVVRYAVVRVEPKVQRVMGGHYVPISMGQSFTAESADHLAASVSTVVYLQIHRFNVAKLAENMKFKMNKFCTCRKSYLQSVDCSRLNRVKVTLRTRE